LVERLPESRSGGYRVNHLKRFVRSAAEDDAGRYFGFAAKSGARYRASLFADRSGIYEGAMMAAEDRFTRLFREADAEDPLDRVFYCDVKTYLTDDILALTDRISMPLAQCECRFSTTSCSSSTATIRGDEAQMVSRSIS
jgi:asparagine synthase (glutamine-hydrolysing)